jgi:hypothetical protein
VPTNSVDKTFNIVYSNGKEVKVKRLSAAKLEDVSVLLQSLFEKFLSYYEYSLNCLGDVLGDPACWGYIEAISAMLPVIGEKEPGINLELLAEDYEQLTQIFLTQSVDVENGVIEEPEPGKALKPSKIAQLYGQNFFRVKALEVLNQTKIQPTT